MEISQQIELVYQRALLLRQYAVESSGSPELLDQALQELYFVLEELKTSQEELHLQNQALIATQQTVELERQRYQTLFELAPNGYLLTDLQGNIHQANHYAAASLLYKPQEYLINKPLQVFVYEPDRSYFQAQLANLKPNQSWEVTLKPRNGTLISVAILVTKINDSGQQKTMLLWSLHDITLRQQMEHQLQTAHDHLETRVAERTTELAETNAQLQQEIHQRQQAEQKIRDQAALIDITTDAIFVLDLDQRIAFWSQGAERLYGWTAAEMLGSPGSLLFSPDTETQLSTGFAQTLEQGSWQTELNHLTQTGKAIIVSSRWTVVRDKTGQPQSILVVNTDITGQKQLETQFYRVQRIESLGTVANNIAFELQDILTPILGYADLRLMQQPVPDELTVEVLQVIKRNAEQGSDLVQQITLFSQASSGQRCFLQPEDLLLELTKTIRQLVPKSIQICTNISTEIASLISADPEQLRQVVINLCVNARDAMPDGGTLTLGLETCDVDATQAQNHLEAQVGNYVVITVSDTGVGIPPALMEQIFEPFFTTKAPEGTGLGLATVFTIVKNHGGFIEFSSQEGKGTQFQVYLPTVAESEAQPLEA